MSTLLRLTVADVGLIERAELEFAPGLTVVTGETGSGKTMLLGGLLLALGGRADSELVRSGATRARAVLEVAPDEALRERLAAAGFELAPDDDLIISREVQASGRSQGRINGIPASAGQLRELADGLVDVVSQHEAQRLLSPAYALEVVDRYGGAPVAAAADAVRAAYAAARDARTRVEQLASGADAARAEFARYALSEIDAAAIASPDEDETLRARRDVLGNAERIVAALSAASAALEEEGSAVDTLGAAEGALLGIARFTAVYAELAASAAVLQSDANELAARIARERDAIEFEPGELDELTARLDVLDTLKRKYGGSLAAVLAQRENFVGDAAGVDERAAQLAAARHDLAARQAELTACAHTLSAARGKAREALAEAVAVELAALAMPAARLSVVFESLPEPGPRGSERAELHFAANPGEAERPLARVASGGELSRVLLALVVVLADRRERTALVFDEIDAGIGGATASAVGARLARLAASAQTLCVTHLAQIASFGEAHVVLSKRNVPSGVAIEANALVPQERTAEIARMLSGDGGRVALEHAALLLSGRDAGHS